MKPDFTKRIESYLSDELTVSEKIEFEQELMHNEAFRQEFTLQKQIHLAAERAVIRKEVKSVGKSYHFFKRVRISLAILLILASGLIASKFFISSSSVEKIEKFSELKEVKQLVNDLKEGLLLSKEATEIFYWEGNDSIFLSKKGVLLSVPKTAFLLDGKPFREKAIIKWEEALDAPTIMKNGLSTMTHGKQLETQGMMGINAFTKEGEKLSIDPKVGIYVQVPVDEYKEGMKLYRGVTDKNGIINWTDPRSLEKALVPVDMKQLNFYPEGYEAKLNELKLPLSKGYRDSLYLSFDKTNVQVIETIEEAVVPFEQYNGEQLFRNKCASCHQVFKDATGPKLYEIRAEWSDGGATDSSIYQFVNDWKEAAASDSYAQRRTGFSTSSMKQFPELSKEEIDAIFDFVDSSPVDISRQSQEGYGAKKKGKLSKNPRDKEGWVDNIRWSFSVKYDGNGEATIISKAKLKEGWHLFSSQHDPKKSNNFGYATRIRLRGSKDYAVIGNSYELEEPSIYHHKRGDFLGNKNEAVFAQKIKINKTESFYVRGFYTFSICSEQRCLFPPTQQFTIKIKGYGGAGKDDDSLKISPSKVLAFWNPEFNNTILATREFERRMKEIHATGNKRLLDLYTQHLDWTIEQLDQKAVEMGYPQFQQFVNEHVGGMSTSKAHIKELQKFYQQTIREFKETLAKNITLKNKITESWNKKVQNARDEEYTRTRKRKSQALDEEAILNLQLVGKQLGMDDRKVKHLGKSVGFRLIRFGNINIDKSIRTRVLEDVIDRRSTRISDDQNLKPINIEYHPMHLKVENAERYDLLFTYLLPDKLNTYERILGRNGLFEYALNDAVKYDLAIVGISDKGYFYKEICNVKVDELMTVDLDQVTEKELDKRINQMNINRGVKAPLSISEEIEWLVIEQKNYIIQKQHKDEKAFRDLIHDIIFPSARKKIQKK